MSSPATIIVTATRAGAASTVVINRGPAGADGVGAGGSSTLAGLSDIATFDLPVENTPLADALALKADSSSLATVATSGSYDDLSDTPTEAFVIPEFAADVSDNANATATTAAIQAAIDTRRAVFIPAGVYKLNATIALKTQGQHIIGESGTRTILEWITDVDGLEIENSTESNVTNFPSSSTEGSGYGRVENLLLQGPLGSTKKAFKNTEDPSPTLWVGEGWRLDFVTFYSWDIGMYSTKAARYNCRSLVFKTIASKAIYLSNSVTPGTPTSAINQCHQFYGVTITGGGTPIPIGIHLENLKGGQFFLQDFAQCETGMLISNSQVDVVGGRLEGYVQHFFDIDAGRVTIQGCNFADGTPTTAPVRVDNGTSLKIDNCEQSQAGNTAPLVLCLDASSSVIGSPARNIIGSTPGNEQIAKVELSNGDVVYLGPYPWVAGTTFFAKDASHRGMAYWKYAGGAGNPSFDDIEAVIEVGGNYVRADAFKTNTYCAESAGGTYTMQGYEDVILMTATNSFAQTVNIKATTDAAYRADATMMRKVTIVDEAGNAGLNNITITADGADTIEGAGSYVINANFGGVTLATRGDGEWIVLDSKDASPDLVAPALGTPASGDLANCTFPTLNQSTTGNAATATALATGREINGVSFDGSANITVTCAAGTLTGTALNSTVTDSSLVSVGTILSGTWQGTAIADAYIASAATWNAKGAAGQVGSHVGPVLAIGATWDVASGHSGSKTMTSSSETVTISNLADGYEASLTVIGAATTGALTLAHSGLTVKGTIDTTSLTTGEECIIGIKRSGSNMLITQSATLS